MGKINESASKSFVVRSYGVSVFKSEGSKVKSGPRKEKQGTCNTAIAAKNQIKIKKITVMCKNALLPLGKEKRNTIFKNKATRLILWLTFHYQTFL